MIYLSESTANNLSSIYCKTLKKASRHLKATKGHSKLISLRCASLLNHTHINDYLQQMSTQFRDRTTSGLNTQQPPNSTIHLSKYNTYENDLLISLQ